MDRLSAHTRFLSVWMSFASAFFLIATGATGLFAQKNILPGMTRQKPGSDIGGLAGSPIHFPGGVPVSCADLNRSSAPSLLQITQDWELRFDSPVSGSYPAVGSVLGGMPENPNLSIGLTFSGSELAFWGLNWVVPESQDSQVSAVILGSPTSGTTVYSYSQLASSDSGSFVAGEGASSISRVSLCFEQFTSPAAARAFVAGRVTDPYGRPLSRARLTLFDLNNGQIRYATSNTFGYYRFTGLVPTDSYLLSIQHRRYLFLTTGESFSLEQNIQDMDFQASN